MGKICLILTIVTLNVQVLAENKCIELSQYLHCKRTVFQKIIGLDQYTEKPIFKYSIPLNSFNEHSEYFKVFDLYKKSLEEKKVGLSYEYYKNNILIGRYVFLLNKRTKKYRRTKATWYAHDGFLLQENIYYILRNIGNSYTHQFTYYNIFGKPIRRVLQFFNQDGKFLYQQSYTE